MTIRGAALSRISVSGGNSPAFLVDLNISTLNLFGSILMIETSLCGSTHHMEQKGDGMYKVSLEGDDTVIRVKRDLMNQEKVTRLLKEHPTEVALEQPLEMEG